MACQECIIETPRNIHNKVRNNQENKQSDSNKKATTSTKSRYPGGTTEAN